MAQGSKPCSRSPGPDICGSDTKKVHIIVNFKNKLYPNKKQIRCKVDGFTHLYTLILRSDHTYEVKIDNEMVASGILEDDWDFLPPRRINDPAVKKPEDWNDEAEIDDPHDTMPEDWNVAEYIVDNGAEKPNDWDDVKQGVWQRPLLKNPLYRGKWQPRKIPNPNYRGIWPHPQIENPVYVPDESISVYENIGVIGLDLWQGQEEKPAAFHPLHPQCPRLLSPSLHHGGREPSTMGGRDGGEKPNGFPAPSVREGWEEKLVRSGTIFDNFLITDSETYAEEFGDETWGETKYPEQKMNQKQIEEEEKREKAREEEKTPKGRVKEVPKQQVSRKKKSQTVAEKGEL
uniref:Uncharacterized protein n=1 Tax=Sphaerodactylus townsendi TaxID=933632 RepID=A0ACB8F1Y8_9SAUR